MHWFDKVRVGLWLGYHQLLDKNYWQISPNFHIADRIGTTDRLLLIYRTDGAKNRLNFAGVGTPAFAHSPTCFTLIINDLSFANISADFLLARRTGLPHPKSLSIRDDNLMIVPTPLLLGTEVITYPILGYDYDRRCTLVAQPIFKKYAKSMTNMYSGEYVNKMTLVPGKLKPIIQTGSQVELYPEEASLDWVPTHIHDANKLLYNSVIQTLSLQSEMLRRVRIWKDEVADKKRQMKYRVNQCIKINAKLIGWIKEDMMSRDS